MNKNKILLDSNRKYQVKLSTRTSETIGCVHFLHGLMEDITMYEPLETFLNTHGYQTILQEIPGCGNMKDLTDWTFQEIERQIVEIMQEWKTEGQPYFLAGFSLGSFLIRDALSKQLLNKDHTDLTGVILIGTGNKSLPELLIGKALAKSRIDRYGRDNTTGVVDDLLLDNYNRAFPEPGGHKFRWLYKDAKARNAFKPGQPVTPGFFLELLEAMQRSQKDIGTLRSTPMLLLSGEDDPVTKDLPKLAHWFQDRGAGPITSLEIKNGRHAILNDACKTETFQALLNFLNLYNDTLPIR